MATVGHLLGDRMKNALMWFYYSWDSIMNLKYNPFRFIGNVSLQMYFMTVLSIFWSMAFCALIAGWAGIVPLLYGHVLTLAAIFVTYGTFIDAEKQESAWFMKWAHDYKMKKAFANRDKPRNACRWDIDIEA